MSMTIYQGQLDIVLPDGSRHDYERFIITRNPDGSRTMRTVTKSPKGDLLRDVNQMVGADWRPIEAMGRLFFKGEAQGTVLRRVVGDRLLSYVWSGNGEMDYAELAAPPNLTLGFHPVMHEAWKMCFIDRTHHAPQPVYIHTVSHTWNGRELSHGGATQNTAEYEGEETRIAQAGQFACSRFLWHTQFGFGLRIWTTGPDMVLVRVAVVGSDRDGTYYDLATFTETTVDDD
jgi:hypothetical protein